MFGIVAMRDRYAVRRSFGGSTGGLKNIEQAVWSEGGIDARFGNLPGDRNNSGSIVLHIHGYARILYQTGLAKAVLNLPSSLIAGISSHGNEADQGQENVAIVFYAGVRGKVRRPVDSNFQFVTRPDE